MGGAAASPKKQVKVEAAPTSKSGNNANDLNAAIAAQGDIVRKLKADKAAKPEVEEAVKKLLSLKADYKAATGQDWKPGAAPVKAASPPAASGSLSSDLNAAITAQGDIVRKLKADKAAKSDIDEAVKKLLSLKADYKTATGQDWKPGAAPAPSKAASPPASSGSSSAADINNSIVSQGDLVRKLKADKA